MNTFLEVFVALGTVILVLLVAAAITNAIFVVLSEFVREIWARISKDGRLRPHLRADPNLAGPNHHAARRNEARG
jgi:hypothetical protein